MDREEDVAILRELADQTRNTADNVSYKIALLRSKKPTKINAGMLEQQEALHKKLMRKVTALSHAIAALIEEGERDD